MLDILDRASLYAKESKCALGTTKLLYLGHIINAEGVCMDPDKVRAILDWSTPKNLTQLRGFIGLCAFYRRFVARFSQHTTPLTDLTRKGAFEWTAQAQECFEKFKEIMMSCLVLKLLDFTRPFELHCDASGEGIGAIHSQDHHPIAFESRKLKGPRDYSVFTTRRCWPLCMPWPNSSST